MFWEDSRCEAPPNRKFSLLPLGFAPCLSPRRITKEVELRRGPASRLARPTGSIFCNIAPLAASPGIRSIVPGNRAQSGLGLIHAMAAATRARDGGPLNQASVAQSKIAINQPANPSDEAPR